MALINCSECGKEISDRATACPHCGCPLTTEKEIKKSSIPTENISVTYNKVSPAKPAKTKLQSSKKNIIITSIVVVSIILIVFAVLFLTHTICINHSYSDATVLEPETCYHCGKTKGEPKELMKIEFPTSGVASLLPLPKSNMGEINWNDAGSFNAYIGNTTLADFQEYVKACMKAGFDVDYQKGEDYYYADDINGNNLNVWFKGREIIEIQIIAPDPEKNDTDFLSKIEESVLGRMKSMSKENYDRKAIVTEELNNLLPFENKEFSDVELKNLALKYIEGLKHQKESSEDEFDVEWQKGTVICYGVLNDLYEKYDFLKDNAEFVNTYITSYEEQQKLLTALELIDKDLNSQVSDNMYGDYDGKNLNFDFKNNTEYTFSMRWEITYFDTKETIVGTETAIVDNIKANSNYKVSFYVPYPNLTDHYTISGNYTDINFVREDNDENFVAQGKTMLMDFLDNASNNGYEIIDPKKDDSFVNAKAKKGNTTFDIQYMVENQKVYMVKVYLGYNVKTSSEYIDCIVGMTKSLNPDISSSVLNDAIDTALSNAGNKVIKSDTLFLFDETKGVFTITH